MSWNYQIIQNQQGEYGLYEVYYDEYRAVTGWTEEPVTFTCSAEETAQGVIKSLVLALKDALNLPVLDEAKLLERSKHEPGVSGTGKESGSRGSGD